MAESDFPGIRVAVVGSSIAKQNYICNGIIGDELLGENGENYQKEPLNDSLNEIFIEVTSIAVNSSEDEVTLQERIHGQTFDILLYCISANAGRPKIEPEEESYRVFRKLLPAGIWNNCIVVLTDADSIITKGQVRNESRSKLMKTYKKTIEEWTAIVRQLFKNPHLPVMPAGSQQSFSILNDGSSWLSNLFQLVLNDENSKIGYVLLKNNLHRIRYNMDNIDINDLPRIKIHEHPIVIKESAKIELKLKPIVAGVAGGSAAGAAGATIGSLIGALAIGIPSFGIFAGLGLVLGGLIGGGIGVGTGVGINKIAEMLQEKDETQGGLL